LLRYFQLPEESEELIRLITEEFNQPVPGSIDPEQVASINKRVSDRLTHHIGLTGPTQPFRRKRPLVVRLLPYVAAAVIAIVVTWLTVGDRQAETMDQEIVNAEEILPGGNKATLRLSDGRTVILDE